MSDYTSTLDYLDSKMDEYGSLDAYLHGELANEDGYREPPMDGVKRAYAPKTIKVMEVDDRPLSNRLKMKFRPCVGCPDCRHWKNFECTNPNPNPEICDSISDRYMEKAE